MRRGPAAAVVPALLAAGALAQAEPAPGAGPAPPGSASASASASAAPSASTRPNDPPSRTPSPGESNAGTSGLSVKGGIELFAQYGVSVTEQPGTEPQWFHQFDLTRLHASLTGQYGPASARVLFEAVRSAGDGGLIGVGGDSVLARIREAYASWSPVAWFDARIGVVPTLVLPALEAGWGLRAVAPTSFESNGLASPADLGVTLRAFLPKGLGTLGVGIYNGEGYTSRELNRGKNTEGQLAIHPIALVPAAEPFTVLGGVSIGSTGTGSGQSNRYLAGLAWLSPRFGAAFTFTWATGIQDAPNREAVQLEGFVRGEPVERLLLGARATYFLRDVGVAASWITTVVGTVGYRVHMPKALASWIPGSPLEVFLALSKNVLGDAARAALPGEDRWDGRFVARIHF